MIHLVLSAADLALSRESSQLDLGHPDTAGVYP